MRIPYGFILASDGVLNINKDEADVISMIFDFYIAGASLGKSWICFTQSKYLLRLEKQNGLVLRLTIFFLTENMWSSSDGRSFWMPNLRSPPAAILTTIKKACRGETRAMFLLTYLRSDLSFAFV